MSNTLFWKDRRDLVSVLGCFSWWAMVVCCWPFQTWHVIGHYWTQSEIKLRDWKLSFDAFFMVFSKKLFSIDFSFEKTLGFGFLFSGALNIAVSRKTKFFCMARCQITTQNCNWANIKPCKNWLDQNSKLFCSIRRI